MHDEQLHRNVPEILAAFSEVQSFVEDRRFNTSLLQLSLSFSAVLRRSPQLRDALQSDDADPATTGLNTNDTKATD